MKHMPFIKAHTMQMTLTCLTPTYHLLGFFLGVEVWCECVADAACSKALLKLDPLAQDSVRVDSFFFLSIFVCLFPFLTRMNPLVGPEEVERFAPKALKTAP